ncbi:MAG: HD domain-containing protein [Actinomycetota bacterium]|nr:HD domain-containing protein [Actinomycetota bacterium]
MSTNEMFLVNGERGLGSPEFGAQRGISELMRDLTPMQEATDLPDLFAGLADSVVGAIHADACLVSLYDDERKVLRDVAASVRPPATLNSVAEEYRLEDFPATREVLETGRAMEASVADPDSDPRERGLLAELGFSRLLLSRFSVDGRTIGTVEAYRVSDRPFRRDDSRRVDVLCSFGANAYSRIQLAAKLEVHYMETIEALVSALEARDPYTEAHAGRIRDTAMALAVAMQLPGEKRRAVKLGSILHDVGKIGISDSILLKPGPLTEEEWAIMKSHPEIGERMLNGIDFLTPVLPIVRHHHERWDGNGYPDRLKGKSIPVGARIVAVCDAFDAMTSDRPYREAMPLDLACEELKRNSGTQFDPECVDLLVDVVSRMGDAHLEDRFVRYAS